jgi:CheY-like chemotaxis protein
MSALCCDVAAAPRVQPSAEPILLVDDDPRVRGAARRALAGAGYQVVEAESGAAALATIATAAVDLHVLIADIEMPQMSGPELAAVLRRQHPDLVVIYLSGYDRETIRDRGLLDHGEAMIEKPFGATTLVAQVRQLLERL